MPTEQQPTWLAEEVADFLATCPTPEALLAYQPSPEARQRLASLLGKSKTGQLTEEEQRELDQFEHVEMLLQMVKARLRAPKVVRR